MIDFLAEHPLAGDEIPGASEAVRGLIYYYLDEAMPVYALLAYAKTAKTDMTPDERRTVSKLAAALKAARKKEMK